VAGALGALTEVYGDLLRGAGAASRLNELLLEQPDIAPPARPTALPVPPRGQLAFQNVGFRYPSRPEVAALEDFSLTVEPGETVAIVGPSGAGKSTLFLLAQRFYDPQAGTVRIDGVPLPSADPAEIRARMALVPQDGTLFAASARDNLRYGNWAASDEDIWEAARRQCRKLPARCPKGSTPSWAKTARAFPAASASASPSPARCCATPRSCCSTKRPARWTPKASAGAGRARPADEGPHHAGHRAPAGHDPRGRPDHRDGRRDRRTGQPRQPDRRQRALRPACAVAVPGRRRLIACAPQGIAEI
jgi:hypothetical protein